MRAEVGLSVRCRSVAGSAENALPATAIFWFTDKRSAAIKQGTLPLIAVIALIATMVLY